MDLRDVWAGRVVEVLTGADLDRRYFGYIDACAGRGTETPLRSADVGAALTAAGLPVSYQRSEDFFRTSRSDVAPGISTGLNVALRGVKLELNLDVRIEGLSVGEPIHSLSRHIAQTRDPAFERTPPYPRIPVTTKAELSDAAAFTVGLYRDLREALTAEADRLTAP
jgi:hypothetical protein